MHGLGTLCNFFAIILGSSIGIVLKKGISERFRTIIMQANGLAVMFIGISGAMAGMIGINGAMLSSQNSMLVVLSLIIGAVLGEAINIEKKLETLGDSLKKKIGSDEKSQFTEGFVTASLVVCVGAMAIVGSIKDGISADASVLYVKSVLDCVIVMIFAASLGIGVLFSAFPLLLYQGLITALAVFIQPFMSEAMISELSTVGSVLIFAVGYNILFGKKIRVGNMLPAFFVPVIYELVKGML